MRTKDLDERQCPMCGEAALVPGTITHWFFRFVQTIKRPHVPYALDSFACAACGFVGHLLPERHLRDLRRKRGDH